MGQEALAKGWYRADFECTIGWYKHRRIFKKILSLQEYDPGQLFWQYLEDVMEEAVNKKLKTKKRILKGTWQHTLKTSRTQSCVQSIKNTWQL